MARGGGWIGKSVKLSLIGSDLFQARFNALDLNSRALNDVRWIVGSEVETDGDDSIEGRICLEFILSEIWQIQFNALERVRRTSRMGSHTSSEGKDEPRGRIRGHVLQHSQGLQSPQGGRERSTDAAGGASAGGRNCVNSSRNRFFSLIGDMDPSARRNMATFDALYDERSRRWPLWEACGYLTGSLLSKRCFRPRISQSEIAVQRSKGRAVYRRDPGESSRGASASVAGKSHVPVCGILPSRLSKLRA